MAKTKKRGLLEGFAASVGKTVRSYFAHTPQADAADLRRGGVPSAERAGLPYNLVSQFGYDGLSEHLKIDQDLQARFSDYEEMDEYPEISVALDIYADDATTPQMDRNDVSIWATCDDKSVQTELNDVMHKRLLLNDDVWGVVRTLAKYGNVYGELLLSEPGLVGIQYMPPPTVRRVEDPRGTLLGFIQDVRGQFNVSLEDFYQLAKGRADGKFAGRAPGELTVFEDWEVVHWRLRGKHLRSVYGHGVIDPARWIWKRLSLLEDALLIYKLERAPARYAFYIDVGQLDAERGLAHVNRVKNSFTRKRFVNPSTGKLDMRYNPLCLAGDTEVRLLNGKVATLAEMASAFDAGEEQWVWASDLEDGGRVRPGKVVWAGKTRKDAQLLRITLDNGKTLRVTPDHKMIRRSGEKVQAQFLKPGDSLMPFRRRVSSKAKGEQLDGYELVYCPKAKKYLYGHRVVARDLGLSVLGEVIHHKDFNPINNEPRNLVGMCPKEHMRLHVELADNHKVVSVEWLEETEDTYTLTVDPCHTFAVEAGVFVCNSHDEDFFVPVRDGKRSTEIDIIQGPDYSETDSLEYHRDKLVSALKIPKVYMGYGGEATRNALSSEDIRFARTVMRLQQVTRSGYRHAMHVHMVARGIDPSKHDFDVKMSVPSQILELSRVEVMSATADLASRMGEFVSSRWLLTHLFKFTEEEAAEVMKEKESETLEKGRVDAKVQKMSMGEGTRGASEDQLVEQRLSEILHAVRRQDWRREFDSNRKADRRLEAKLEDLLKQDQHTKKRLREMGGLMLDVRNAMRQSGAR